MDSIIAEVTSNEFWVGVLLGNVLFVGGLVYLISSVSPQRSTSAAELKNRPQNKRN